MVRMLRSFARDTRGSVLIFVGLAMVVLFGVIGVGIDLGTQTIIRTRMQNAADAAALAGSIADGVTDAQRTAIARRYFALNHPDRYLGTDLTAANVGITSANDSVLVDTNLRTRKADIVPILGQQQIKTRAISEVRNTNSVSSEIRDVVMVMDSSTSMYDLLPGGTQRIVEAKRAANTLIDEIICNVPARGSRVGWVEYTTDCSGANSCTDVTRSLALSASCPALRDAVTIYTPRGATNGAEGLERAESLLASARPNVVRAVVYMTDGLNNTYRNRNYCYDPADVAGCLEGSGSPVADVPARDACDRIKARGVLVYGIAFSSTAQNAQIVRDCASGPDYYFYAPDAASLQTAFREIVTRIKKIRITR